MSTKLENANDINLNNVESSEENTMVEIISIQGEELEKLDKDLFESVEGFEVFLLESDVVGEEVNVKKNIKNRKPVKGKLCNGIILDKYSIFRFGQVLISSKPKKIKSTYLAPYGWMENKFATISTGGVPQDVLDSIIPIQVRLIGKLNDGTVVASIDDSDVDY